MLVNTAPQDYQDFMLYEGKHKIIYVEMKKALHGMLQSLLLYYKKFRKDLKGIGFIVNLYNPCTSNRIVNGKQHMVTWHVNNLKPSHVNPEVNNEFLHWLKRTYANDNIGKIKAVRDKCHNYLAITLDYEMPGVLKVNMTAYVRRMMNEFPNIL